MKAAQRGSRKVSPRFLWAVTVALLAGAVLIAVIAAEVATRLLQRAKRGTIATIEQQYTIDSRLNLRVPIANPPRRSDQSQQPGVPRPEICLPQQSRTVRIAFLDASTTSLGGGLRQRQDLAQPVADDFRHRSRGLAAAKEAGAPSPPVRPSWRAYQLLLRDFADENWRMWLAQRKVAAKVERFEVEPTLMRAQFRSDLTALVLAKRAKSKAAAVAMSSTRLRTSQCEEERLQAAASASCYMPFKNPDDLLASCARYKELICEVARQTGMLFIDAEHDITGDDRYFTDSMDFTDVGSRAMAACVANAPTASPTTGAMFL